MTESLISNEQKCYICGTTRSLERHHVFYGTARRKISEDQGCWVWLCKRHHTGSNFAVHKDFDVDDALKKLCQKKWQCKNQKTTQDFIDLFGKNYLLGEHEKTQEL